MHPVPARVIGESVTLLFVDYDSNLCKKGHLQAGGLTGAVHL